MVLKVWPLTKITRKLVEGKHPQASSVLTSPPGRSDDTECFEVKYLLGIPTRDGLSHLPEN